MRLSARAGTCSDAHSGPGKINLFTRPRVSLKSQGVEGTSEGRQAKPLLCLYPGWADNRRRQPLSLTHPAVRHYPQLSNLGKSQTVRETGRDCQRSFGSSCILPPPRREALLFTWTPQVVCQPHSSPQQFLCHLSQAMLPFRSSRWTSPNCQALWLLVLTMPPSWTAD